MPLALTAASLAGCAVQRPIVVQAEQGKLDANLSIATTRPSFEGTGYVTGFTNEQGRLALVVDAPRAGIYDLSIRYASETSKAYDLLINSVGYDGLFAASVPGAFTATSQPTTQPAVFQTREAGKVELKRGPNAFTIGGGWGFYDLDAMTLAPSKPYPPPQPVPATLVNPNATPAARGLMTTLVRDYGKVTRSGVISEADRTYIHSVASVTPAIFGGDLMDYSPSRRARGADPKDQTERLIQAARDGHIVTVCWHWNAPTDLIDDSQHVNAQGQPVNAVWYRGFYSDATRFDFEAALDDPKSPGYALLLRDIDAIAVELRKLADADVPVLWRPLHEADGGWFWWGTRGRQSYQRLWRLLYDRLTVHHGLNNLIWVYTYEHPDWYPGDDVADVIGIDAYPSDVTDPLVGRWLPARQRFDGKKLIALTEIGGVPDLQRMKRLGVVWSYFASWTGAEGPAKTPAVDIARIYRAPVTANR